MPLLTFDGALDLARMRRERFGKLQTLMTAQGVDALFLLNTANTYYASGAGRLGADGGRAKMEPVAVLVVQGDSAPHVFTPYPEGAPTDLPADHLHGTLYVEFDQGVKELGERISQRVGQKKFRLGIDNYSAAMFEALPELLPDVEFVDAGGVLSEARLLKTADEIECLRRAQHINDVAMLDVQSSLRAGMSQAELTGLYYRRIYALGATANLLDPIWDVAEKHRSDFAPSTHDDLPFPLVASNQVLQDGQVLWMDTGLAYEGYASDFGRTWIVGADPTPPPELQDQYRRYADTIAAVLDVAKPGVSAYDLTSAAKKVAGGKVWLDHLYLGHGVGLSSAEAPFIGSDLGDDFDRQTELREGMIIVLEPVFWQEGVGGYRAEETIALTADGFTKLNSYSYEPFA